MLARVRPKLGRLASPSLRLVVALGLLVACAANVSPVQAEPREVLTSPEAFASVQRAKPYLEQLLSEINAHRARAGTPPLAFAPIAANAAIAQYLTDLTPRMVQQGRCFHGDGQTVRPGWDYTSAYGFVAEPGGEVLACPDTRGYWTAAKLAERWWGSETHRQTLYADSTANLVACGTFGPLNDDKAYQTIACVTFRG